MSAASVPDLTILVSVSASEGHGTITYHLGSTEANGTLPIVGCRLWGHDDAAVVLDTTSDLDSDPISC